MTETPSRPNDAMLQHNVRLIAGFSASDPDPGWFVLNDDVMGGRSEGDFERTAETLRFTGRTNTDGGGFSSIRTRAMQLDLSAFTGIRLRLRADGRRYSWRLATDALWRGSPISYWAEFDTPQDEWLEVDLPFADFVPRFRGRRLDGPALDPHRVTGMGLMIYDRVDGPFEFELAAVMAYSDEPGFSLESYRWRNRVLVVSAPDASDPRLQEQTRAIARSSGEFTERDLVLLTILDEGPSTAGDRVLETEHSASVRSALGINPGSFAVRLVGKDGTVKLAREAFVPMAEIYSLIDTMPMRKREMQDR